MSGTTAEKRKDEEEKKAEEEKKPHEEKKPFFTLKLGSLKMNLVGSGKGKKHPEEDKVLQDQSKNLSIKNDSSEKAHIAVPKSKLVKESEENLRKYEEINAMINMLDTSGSITDKITGVVRTNKQLNTFLETLNAINDYLRHFKTNVLESTGTRHYSVSTQFYYTNKSFVDGITYGKTIPDDKANVYVGDYTKGGIFIWKKEIAQEDKMEIANLIKFGSKGKRSYLDDTIPARVAEALRESQADLTQGDNVLLHIYSDELDRIEKERREGYFKNMFTKEFLELFISKEPLEERLKAIKNEMENYAERLKSENGSHVSVSFLERKIL
jgi:hypothetical protein